MFGRLYARVLQWSQHRHAPVYLGLVCFVESSFFPIPPMVMLGPMILAERRRAWYYAGIATMTSALGGLLGYAIGMFAFQLVQPWLVSWGHWDDYLRAKEWFAEWGVWVVFFSGIAPVPYKIFTIASGTLALPIVPFFLASLFARATRFFLFTAVIYLGGERLERLLERYVEYLGWGAVFIIIVGYFIWRA